MSANAQTTNFDVYVTMEGVNDQNPAGNTAGTNLAQTFTFTFCDLDASGASVSSRTVRLDSLGHYKFTNLTPHHYSLIVTGHKWLRTSLASVDLTTTNPSQTVFMRGGDADNNNVVDIGDWGIFINAYGSSASMPGSGYDERADFTCDGVVDIGDFGVFQNESGSGGAISRIQLDAPVSPSVGKIALKWRLLDASGVPTTTPAGTTFTLYRSPTPTHGSTAYKTVTVPYSQSDTTFTDTATTIGTYYYQIVARVPSLFPNTPANYTLSEEGKIVIAPNPQISQISNLTYITGYKPDLTTVIYQATLTDGVLSSYKVKNHELLHLPVQFSPSIEYHTLSRGGQTFTPSASTPPTFLDFHTIAFTGSDANGVNINVTYNASPTGLYMTLNAASGLNFCLPLGDVAAVQDNPFVGLGYDNVPIAGLGYSRIPGTGTTYALPVPHTYKLGNGDHYDDIVSLRNLRCLFGDGSGVNFTYTFNDSTYPENNGHLFTNVSQSNNPSQDAYNAYASWGCIFSSNVELHFDTYNVDAPNTSRVNTAPPFHLSISPIFRTSRRNAV